MPLPWLPATLCEVDRLAREVRIERAQEPAQSRPQVQTRQIDERLVIQFENVLTTLDPRVMTFTGSVSATYDVTVVTSDRLVIYLDEKRGEASGNVVLTDPAGVVRADRLTFNWEQKTGSADNVDVDALGVIAEAARINISPREWELLNVSGTPCRQKPPFFSVASRRIVLTPGRSGKAERPRLSIMGRRLLNLPDYRFSLDPRTTGFRLPAVAFERGSGLGVTWSSGFLLGDDRTGITGNLASFPGRLPRYGIQATRTFVPFSQQRGLIAPRSELGERFNFGYFENVTVEKPESERNFVRARRDAASIGSFWNVGASARLGEEDFSKPIELTYERGGPLGDGGFISQVRLQSIQKVGGPNHARALVLGSLLLPPRELARGLRAVSRIDASGFFGSSLFGWARGSVGVVFQPVKQLRVGAAYVRAFEAGSPLFEADRLVAPNAYHLRGDLDLGPTRFSYLVKYDIDRGSWYDLEYTASQVVGCLEAFVVSRKFPSDYKFGVRLRLDEFFDALGRRQIRRGTRATPPAAGKGSPGSGLGGSPPAR